MILHFKRALFFTSILVIVFIYTFFAAAPTAVNGSFGPAALPQADPPLVRLVTEPVSGDVGDTFATQVYIDNIPEDPGLQGYSVTINFDGAILSLTEGDISFDLIWPSGTAFPMIDLDDNSLYFGQTPVGANSYPFGNNLMVATIEWTGVGAGVSPLDVNNSILLSNAFSGETYPDVVEMDGSVTVNYIEYLPVIIR
ncbi:MAG: hypothetical protein GY759_10235 [Chloroflexi bacterium]|nr:hypothetical protein [Chloroflexota bacterium]